MSPRILIFDEHGTNYAERIRAAFPDVPVDVSRTPDELPSDLSGIDVLIAFGIAVDDAMVARMSGLKWIQSLATGVDHFLRLPALHADILLTSTRGIHGPQMREMVVFQMLALGHDISRLAANNAAHKWRRYPRSLLANKTAVVVGLGVSGIAIGQLLNAFQMRVIGVTHTLRDIKGFDSFIPASDLAKAAAQADYLINVLPGNPEYDGLYNREIFDAMKPGACFINVGRGQSVDDDALIEALRSGAIAGAAVDVFSDAPLQPDHPYWDAPNLLITPHVAGYCDEYEGQASEIILDNLRHFKSGETGKMRNVVPH